MPKPSASKRVLALGLAAFAAGAAGAAPAPPAPLRFEQVFDTRRPASVHYEAQFLARDGRTQQVQAWRDGDLRLKRRTGDALEVYAVHAPGEPEYEMTVLDLRRKIMTRIARTNLFRIGNFTDWFDLAHGLKHPRGDYTLRSASPPQGAGPQVGACTWYALGQGGRVSDVCWSVRAQLPLAIVDAQGRTVWQVTRLVLGPIAPDVFQVDAHDYVLNDANSDIERD